MDDDAPWPDPTNEKRECHSVEADSSGVGESDAGEVLKDDTCDRCGAGETKAAPGGLLMLISDKAVVARRPVDCGETGARERCGVVLGLEMSEPG